MRLSEAAVAELRFWASEIRPAAVRGGPISVCGVTTQLRGYELAGVMCSDTGARAAGYWAQRPVSSRASRSLGRQLLPGEERERSSARRELLGCELALRMRVGPAADQQEGGSLIYLGDNRSAVRALANG